MKKYISILCCLIIMLSFTGCHEDFDGSVFEDSSQFTMSYKILDTTESHFLKLEKGDTIDADIVSNSGSLSIIIQKNHEDPIYESEDTPTGTFQVKIDESGLYEITVTGKQARGSVSFVKDKKL